MTKVPKTLRELRGELSLIEFGKRVGYSYQVVQQYETGTPSEKYLRKICEVFGIGRQEISVGEKAPGALKMGEGPLTRMSAQEFRDAADRMGVECHIRGHLIAARALMDLVESLDNLSGESAIAAKSEKVRGAIAASIETAAAALPKRDDEVPQ